MKFFLPQKLLNKRISIAVIGVGGTGGEIIDALTRLDFGIKALGHPEGIHVTAFDDDIVERHNIGRQRFNMSDINRPKSLTLINRVNMFYGFDWSAYAKKFKAETKFVECYDIIICCVDKASFRAELGRLGESYSEWDSYSDTLWLDLGNGKSNGQCVLGHIARNIDSPLRLPNVFDLYPELTDEKLDNDGTPNCSLADALIGENGQDLFINRSMADFGMNLLWKLLTKDGIEYHGGFMDIDSMTSQPLKIDLDTWEFFGYRPMNNLVVNYF
jgi:PRTRC genetic system ThiF family protein